MQGLAVWNKVNMAVSVVTTLTCTNKVEGFTGGFCVVYYDAQGNLLGQSGTVQHGIGQAPIIPPFVAHDQRPWPAAGDPPEFAPAGTASVGFFMFADPQNRFGALGDLAESLVDFIDDAANWVSEAGVAIENWCNANPNACGAIFGLFFIGAGATLFLLAPGTVSCGIEDGGFWCKKTFDGSGGT
jgi:hypothetical protein